METEVTTNVETPDTEIGEEYVENTQEQKIEPEESNADSKPAPKDSAPQKKQRSREESIELAAEFYGVEKEDVIIDKSGDIKLVMKINGRKRLVTPQEFKKGFNLNQAGYEKLEEGKKLRSQVDQLFKEMKTNPKRVRQLLDELGLDSNKLAQEWLEETIRESEMSDEDKKARDREKRLQELEEENNKYKMEQEQKKIEALKNEQIQKYDMELTAAMKKHGFTTANTKVKSHILMGAIGKLMLANQAGRDLSCDDAVYLARQEWQDYTLGLFDEIDEHHILSLLPDKVIKAIRKADIARLDRGIPTSNRVPDEIDQKVDLPDVEPSRKTKRKTLMSEYFNNLTG